MIEYSTEAYNLIKNGYLPLPIKPMDKAPAVSRWSESSYTPPAGFKDHGIGIRCGEVSAVDIDCLNEAMAKEMQDFTESLVGDTIYRIGKAPKVLLVYRAAEPLKKVTSTMYTDESGQNARVEILGDGQQFVAFGVHPETKQPYTWPSFLGDITDLPLDNLPTINSDQIKQIVDKFENLATKKGYAVKKKVSERPDAPDYDPDDPFADIPMGIDFSRIKKVVEQCEPDGSREEWLDIGMALHHEYQGSEDAFALWDEWSAKGEKYKEGETRTCWDGFGKKEGRKITGATLLKIEKDIENEVEARRLADYNPDDIFASLNGSTTRFKNDPPHIPMLIENFFPLGITGMFFSAGGVGKSTVMLKMAMHIAIAEEIENDFFLYPVNGGRVVIVTAEDPDIILNRRFIFVLRSLAETLGKTFEEVREVVDRNLTIISTFGTQVHLFEMNSKGELKPTKHFTSLNRALAKVENLKLVVIDTKARFSTAEGEGNNVATQEVTYYEHIAKTTGASVVLLHHTTKASRDGSQSGAQAFRDASAVFDSIRIAWYLRGMNDKECKEMDIQPKDRRHYLYLENAKNNYIEGSDPLILKRDGYSYEIIKQVVKMSSAEKAEARAESIYNIIFGILRSNVSGLSIAELQTIAKRENSLARRPVKDAIEGMVEEGFVEIKPAGMQKLYVLTEAGKQYDLTINEEEE